MHTNKTNKIRNYLYENDNFVIHHLIKKYVSWYKRILSFYYSNKHKTIFYINKYQKVKFHYPLVAIWRITNLNKHILCDGFSMTRKSNTKKSWMNVTTLFAG